MRAGFGDEPQRRQAIKEWVAPPGGDAVSFDAQAVVARVVLWTKDQMPALQKARDGWGILLVRIYERS